MTDWKAAGVCGHCSGKLEISDRQNSHSGQETKHRLTVTWGIYHVVTSLSKYLSSNLTRWAWLLWYIPQVMDLNSVLENLEKMIKHYATLDF